MAEKEMSQERDKNTYTFVGVTIIHTYGKSMKPVKWKSGSLGKQGAKGAGEMQSLK